LEAIMSSPIHHAEDLDAALVYAPPWAREQGGPERPLARRSPQRLRPVDVQPAYSGDRAMMELQRQLALNPDQIPEPPGEDMRSLWPLALRFSVVAGIAAIAAWAMVSLTGVRKTANEVVQVATPPLVPADINRVRVVEIRSAADAAPPVPVGSFASVAPPVVAAGVTSPIAAAGAPSPNAASGVAPAVAAVGVSSPVAVAATPVASLSAPGPTAPPQSALPAPESPALQISDDEINTLVKRGQDLFQTGDLASARLLLRRAADAGSASAALALGSTFDPVVIQRLGAIGIEPDAARARKWYQRAVELASTTASQQLAKLDQAR
jgi:hypothetical protein